MRKWIFIAPFKLSIITSSNGIDLLLFFFSIFINKTYANNVRILQNENLSIVQTACSFIDLIRAMYLDLDLNLQD